MTETKTLTILPAPEESNDLLASLPQSLRSSLTPRLSADYELIGFDILPGYKPSPAVIEEAKFTLAKKARPASKALLGQEIGRCLVSTQSRERDRGDVKALAAILLEELLAFPAEAALKALRHWGTEETWWPSVADIRKLARSYSAELRALEAALKRLDAMPEAEPIRTRQPLTEASLRKLEEVFPEIAKKARARA